MSATANGMFDAAIFFISSYLLSGDPAYIPRYRDARNLIRRHERDEIMEVLIRYYLGNHGINL